MRRIRLCVLLLFINFLLTGQDARNANASRSSEGTNADVPVAPVVIDGETLFSVRGVTAYPAERRAEEIQDRVRAVAANPAINAKSLTLDDQPGTTWITSDGQRIMSVLDEDAALESIGRHRLAEIYRTRIAEVIDDYRSNRRPGVLILHAVFALCATLALLLVAHFGRRFVGRFHAAVEARYQSRVRGLEGRAMHLVKADQIW